jgi:histidine triad (HIT) family protein
MRPQAPVHFLIIPKEHVETLYDADIASTRALGRMLGWPGSSRGNRG